MPVPLSMVTRFFQLLARRQFAEAERELERIKERMHKTEYNRGYFRALRGLWLARRSNNDQYTFLSKLDFNDKKVLRSYRREFLSHVKSKLHGDFDRGYFAAWAECMRVLSKIVVNDPEPKEQQPKKEKPPSEKEQPRKKELPKKVEPPKRIELKTVEGDKSQVVIESFFEGKA